MARRKDERRVNFVAGLFVIALLALMFLSLFVIANSEGWLEAKTTVGAHFRTVGGLRRGSAVQLGGTKIGTVAATDFISPSYVCDPVSEDHGRGADRTDACDPSLFCSPKGLCAEFEDYTGNPTAYQACANDDTCGESETCVTEVFRRRYRRVRWTGSAGWCVPYLTTHRRIHVTMQISEDTLRYIRIDSRATIATAGVLGDQLINVTVGSGSPVREGGRIQASPSLMEEIAYFKERLELITDKVGTSLSGVAGLFDSLDNDRTKRDLRGLLANSNEITRQIKDGDGLVGALFNDPEYRAEFGLTLRSVRQSAADVEAATAALRTELEPTLRESSRAAKNLADLVVELRNPENQSLVGRAFHDAEMGASVKHAVASADDTLTEARDTLVEAHAAVAEVRGSIERGEGTLGKLIKDPKAYNDLLRFLGNLERNNLLKRFVRFVIERDEASSSVRPAPQAAGQSNSRSSRKKDP
ncbi:MAG: hypothetical protein V3V08_01925 [Nannocystaceae bacterium]